MDKNLKTEYDARLNKAGIPPAKLERNKDPQTGQIPYGIGIEADRLSDNCARLDDAINYLIGRINFILKPQESSPEPVVDRAVFGSMHLCRLVSVNDRLEAAIQLLKKMGDGVDN